MTTNSTKRMFSLGRQTFEYLADLEWFDGALISLFRDVATRELFVLHWLDVSKDFHKWLFFPVTPRGLKLYLEGKLTNEDLLWLTNPSTVRIIELNGDMQLGKVEEIATTALPQAMLPTNEGGFEHGSCPDLSRIREILAEYPAMALATA